MKKSAKITTKELEQRFDEGGDVLEFFDTAKAEVEDPKTQRVNVDFPEWMVKRLDDEARRLSITRQALIKFLLNGVLSGRSSFQRIAPLSASLFPSSGDIFGSTYPKAESESLTATGTAFYLAEALKLADITHLAEALELTRIKR